MKPLRRYSKTIRCDVYDTDFLFVIGGKPSEAVAELCDLMGLSEEKKKDGMALAGDEDPCLGRALFPPGTKRTAVIWLPEIPETPRAIGTVAHECLHITAKLAAEAGVEWTTHHETKRPWVNDEAFCYLLGFFVRGFMEFAEGVKILRDRRAKKKKKH